MTTWHDLKKQPPLDAAFFYACSQRYCHFVWRLFYVCRSSKLLCGSRKTVSWWIVVRLHGAVFHFSLEHITSIYKNYKKLTSSDIASGTIAHDALAHHGPMFPATRAEANEYSSQSDAQHEISYLKHLFNWKMNNHCKKNTFGSNLQNNRQQLLQRDKLPALDTSTTTQLNDTLPIKNCHHRQTLLLVVLRKRLLSPKATFVTKNIDGSKTQPIYHVIRNFIIRVKQIILTSE